MITKEDAFKATKAAQFQVIEDAVLETSSKGEFETEVLNLTEEEQGILTAAGYKLTQTANKQGSVWKINWE